MAAAPYQQQQLQQQVQAGAQENQMRQMQIDDTKARNTAFQQWDGKSFDDIPKLMKKNGASVDSVMALQKSLTDSKEKLLQLDSGTFKLQQDKNNALLGKLQAATEGDDAGLPARIMQTAQDAVQGGLLDPQHAQQVAQMVQQTQDPAKLKQALGVYEKSLMGQKEQFDQADKLRKTAAEELTAQSKVDAAARPTETSLAVAAASGDADAEAALKRLDASKRASRPVVQSLIGNDDVKNIADAIENGDQPPTLQGMYKMGAPVRAELARRGVPIAKMEMDWNATKKYIATLNGPQQTRLRQDISTVSDSLDKVEGLYNEWQQLAPTSGFKVLNKTSLAAMKQLPGRAGAVAQALEAQIADTTAGLGTIYMGGNSPTDHSLSLAAHSLSSDWNNETFKEALKQARANVKIRENSILHAQPAGASADNTYAPKSETPSSGGAVSIPSGAKTATGPNGHKIFVQGNQWIDSVTGKPLQ